MFHRLAMIIPRRRSALRPWPRAIAIADFCSRLRRDRRRSATLRALGRLDDAALADIGVTRTVLPHETLYAAPPATPGAEHP